MQRRFVQEGRVDRRATAKHSRDSLPIGTLRIRTRRRGGGKSYQARFIKILNSGPFHRRWILYSRYVWERAHGPVPDGQRIAHRDGNTLNDNLDNLVMVSPGDVAFLWHDRDPDGSERNYEKLREVTAQRNRETGRVNRLLKWLPTFWYVVYPERRAAINDPHRSRRRILAKWAPDVSISLNGAIPKSITLPFELLRGREIAAMEPPLTKLDPETLEPVDRH